MKYLILIAHSILLSLAVTWIIIKETGIALPIGATLTIKDETGTVIYEQTNHESQTIVVYPYDCVSQFQDLDNLTVHTGI